MPVVRLQHEFLSCTFGFAVNADRLGRIFFQIRFALFAVENVIRTEMNQLRSFVAANFREHFWRFGVDRECFGGFRLTKIDICHRGAIEQQIEFKRPESVSNLVRLRQIE